MTEPTIEDCIDLLERELTNLRQERPFSLFETIRYRMKETTIVHLRRLQAINGALSFGTEDDAYDALVGAIYNLEESKGEYDRISMDTLRRIERQLGRASAASEQGAS